uniref:DC_STAMP domain-containing protein n=1 Tax=Rhabditophanes sp. KR3021 TaxID=114890 RepID=A0AC35UG77_9BILA
MSYTDIITARRRCLQAIRKFEISKQNSKRKQEGEKEMLSEYSSFQLLLRKIFPFLGKEHDYGASNWYENIFVDGTRQNSFCNILLFFAMTQVIGLFILTITLLKYAIFPQRAGVLIGITVQVITSFAIWCKHIRCIILLSMPAFFTSKVRQIIVVFIILWTFQSSAMNITSNLQTMAEGVSCVQNRVISTVNEVFGNANDALGQQTIDEVIEIVKTLLSPMETFKKNIAGLLDMVKKVTNLFTGQSSLFKAVEDVCDQTAAGPEARCRRFVNESITDCQTIMWDPLCYPINILYTSCNALAMAVSRCNFPASVMTFVKSGVNSIINSATNETISNIKDNGKFSIFGEMSEMAMEALQGQTMVRDFGLNFTNEYKPDFQSQVDLGKVQEIIKKEFEAFVWFSQKLELFLNSGLYFLIFEGFAWSTWYLFKFLISEKKDNHYIGEAFIKYDVQREIQGMSCLLPLLPKEKLQYIRFYQKKMVKDERRWTYYRIAMTLFGGVVPFFIITIDITLYNCFEMIFHFLTDDTFFEFPSLYKFKIGGNGMFANLINKILAIFEPLSEATQKKDNMWTRCMTEPSPPDYFLFERMFYLFLFGLLLCPMESYFKRFRHVVAESFFKNRRKARLIWLYNEILENRRNSIQQGMVASRGMDQQMKLIKDHKGAGPKRNLVNRALPVLSKDTYACTKCARGDLRISDGHNTRICVNCHAVYCVDCYTIRKRCIDCNYTLQIMSSKIEFYMDSSGDESENSVSSLSTSSVSDQANL